MVSHPSARSRSTTYDPKKPAPPVTHTRLWDQKSDRATSNSDAGDKSYCTATSPRRFSAPLASRGPRLQDLARLVGIERLLRRAQLRRHMLKVDADARPRVEAAAHRVDQHV